MLKRAFFTLRLYRFCAEPNFVPFKIEITQFERSSATGDKEGEVVISARGFGETFQLGKHPQGTEVKAITYSAMKINERQDFSEVFVIIDI
jgi:SHS2 domain-containing protein